MQIIRYVGKKTCVDPSYAAGIEASGAAVVDTISDAANVTLTWSRDGGFVWVPLRDMWRDFLDLAVSIYIGDELDARSDSVDNWTRVFRLVVPVEDPPLWQGADGLLSQTLSFLSGDIYEFEWPKRSALPRRVHHRRKLPRGYDTVCLFSGGLDSLLGAYRLLEGGRKVLLVGHQAEGIASSAQKDLARVLRRLFPDRCTFIQCRVARSPRDVPKIELPEKVEDSHRTRSFLFLALAVAVANAAHVDEIVIAENGLIALNIPIQPSRLGSLSTRTAHPIYLQALCEFLSRTALFGGRLWNPFLFESKTDVVSNLPTELRDAAVRSVSCSHGGRVRGRSSADGRNHCGYCVPCLYRRAAMMGVGLDSGAHYVHDVFRNLSGLTDIQQVDFRALVGFAQRLAASSPTALERLVLAHGPFSPELAERIGPSAASDLTPWTRMLARWAAHFLDLVIAASSAATLRTLSLSQPRKKVAP